MTSSEALNYNDLEMSTNTITSSDNSITQNISTDNNILMKKSMKYSHTTNSIHESSIGNTSTHSLHHIGHYSNHTKRSRGASISLMKTSHSHVGYAIPFDHNKPSHSYDNNAKHNNGTQWSNTHSNGRIENILNRSG
jgi:hypothetical protein